MERIIPHNIHLGVKTIHERVLKSAYNPKGYVKVSLGKGNQKQVHRLVAQAFIPNPENKPNVNHINGITSDNRVENLEWCTQAENVNHAKETGKFDCITGKNNHRTKLNEVQVLEIKRKYKTGNYIKYLFI